MLIRALVELHASTWHNRCTYCEGQRPSSIIDKDTIPDFAYFKEIRWTSSFCPISGEMVRVQDESILLDVDTPEDYQRLLDME